MNQYMKLLKYYPFVEFCSCFKTPISSEVSNISDHVYCFNKLLPEEYKFNTEDCSEVIMIYRNWLIESYLNPYYDFNTKFSKYKYKEIKALEEYFGAATKESFFMLQSMERFLHEFFWDRWVRDSCKGIQIAINPNFQLTDNGIVCFKLYLSCCYAFIIIGDNSYDHLIQTIKESLNQKTCLFR